MAGLLAELCQTCCGIIGGTSHISLNKDRKEKEKKKEKKKGTDLFLLKKRVTYIECFHAEVITYCFARLSPPYSSARTQQAGGLCLRRRLSVLSRKPQVS